MRPLLRLTLIALLAQAPLAAVAFAEELVVETARGPVTLSARPERIVVYDIDAMDSLDALGVTLAGVPRPHFLESLDAAAARATPVGGVFEPDYEALAKLDPDLIVIGKRTARHADTLGRIGPVIDMSVWGDDHLQQVLDRLAAYGAMTGREERAAALAEALESKLALARQAVAGKGDALIILTNGPKISAFGAGSRFGWLHQSLGLPEARAGLESSTHGEAVSFEFIAEIDPDWLLVIDRGAAIGEAGAGAAATLDNALVAGTKAWRTGQVIYLPASRIYVASGGVRSVSSILDQVTAAFNGSS